jgi:hypothetical protein
LPVMINDREYRIREESPGVIQFVAVDENGHAISTLEATIEVISGGHYGPVVRCAVDAYLESFDHLCQLAVDYGYTFTHQGQGDDTTDCCARLRKTTLLDARKYEYLSLYKFRDVFWQHWVQNQSTDDQGVGSASLWKFLNK